MEDFLFIKVIIVMTLFNSIISLKTAWKSSAFDERELFHRRECLSN